MTAREQGVVKWFNDTKASALSNAMAATMYSFTSVQSKATATVHYVMAPTR